MPALRSRLDAFDLDELQPGDLDDDPFALTDDELDRDDAIDAMAAEAGLPVAEWMALNFVDGYYCGQPNPTLDAYRDPYLM